MKSTLLISLLFIVFSSFAQEEIPTFKKEPCWKKSADRAGQRYAQWECGLSDTVVDCGEKLEMDPGTNTVFSRGTASPYTGYCETCHMNGLKQRTVYFVNGKQQGTDTTYYQSGCPQVVTSYVAGLENGVWTYYNDSSALEAWQIAYLDGQKHGKSIYWKQFITGKDAAGNALYARDTAKIENYNNGLLHGVKSDYWKDSKLRKEVYYKNGLLEGSFKTYNNEGTLTQDLNYKEGQKDGEFKYYFDNGVLLKTEVWDEGEKDGNFITYYTQGFVQLSENYKNDKKEGWFEERFPDNKIKRQALYKKDILVEEHVYDKYGNEIRTLGGEATVGKEDDAIPTDSKAAKKAKKAEKKRLKEERKRLKKEAKSKKI